MAKAVSLVVNPSAGGGRAPRAAELAAAALRRRGFAVRSERTTSLEHARELAAAAAREGRTVVAAGGDGLIGAIADALLNLPDATLGIVPAGRGNDFARVLSIPTDGERAAAVIAAGHVRAVDLGAVERGPIEPRAFVGIASAGFDSEANRIANEAPSWLGGAVYAYGALRALARWRPASLRVEVETEAYDVSYEFRGYTVAVANSRAYGGGMFIAPDAMLDDGLLDVVCVGEGSKLNFLASLPKVFKGTHVNEERVRVIRGSRVTLSADRPFTLYADGDPIGELPVTVSALRGAVQILVPAAPGPALGAP